MQLARKQKKPIIAAEMVPTDPRKLAKKYKKIPPSTDAHNDGALSAALLAAVQQLAIRDHLREEAEWKK